MELTESKFRWGLMFVKMAVVLFAGGLAWPTADKLVDAIRASGASLDESDVQFLTWLVCTAIPAVAVGLVNRIKQTERYKQWKARRKTLRAGNAAAAGLVLLCLLLPTGCMTGPDGKQVPDWDRIERIAAVAVDFWIDYDAARAVARPAETQAELDRQILGESLIVGAVNYVSLPRDDPDRLGKALEAAKAYSRETYDVDLVALAMRTVRGKPEGVSDEDILRGLLQERLRRGFNLEPT
jgi:hypothetical protein